MEEVTDYLALVEQDEHGWSIYVPAVDRHTWTPHLREVEDMARDLVQVMTDLPIADIAVSVQLPEGLSALIDNMEKARSAAEDADAAAREAQRLAVSALRTAGATMRDIAAALGISYQRVHQVLADVTARGNKLAELQSSVAAWLPALDDSLVRSDSGEVAVVAALGDELLTTLFARLQEAGGTANVFVLSPNGRVRFVAVVSEECALGQPGDDLTGPHAPGEGALIDTFIDYVELHETGVAVAAVTGGAKAKDVRTLVGA